MVSTGTLAAAALTANDVPQAVTVPSGSSSPALRAAIGRLAKAHEALIGAQATNEEAEAIFEDWWEKNPKLPANAPSGQAPTTISSPRHRGKP